MADDVRSGTPIIHLVQMKLSTHQWPAANREHSPCPLWTTISPQRSSECILTRGDQQPLQVGYLCSTVQILDSLICKSLRGHWWSVSVQHLLDKERRWNHGLHGKQNWHWFWRGEQVQLISTRKITESLGREGSPPLHHSVRLCFGRSVLNPPRLVN